MSDHQMNQEDIFREQIQAAYALNLCSVSVSQIIDYNDITILEQEYETILNNLNLENMPKDEALLDILKHLLETITFFRIQEGDKKFVEKEYQLKMKNAIWSAVPNLGLIVAGGNPATMAISLASQVGIGYMNYRKNRSEYQMEREKQYWQLQRTAIEQFESLQQQLFETAWRLADKYGFPDFFRLTERQIRQYNAILMDSDEPRKYERLDAIKDRFIAYPPFWYYFGNTANAIANSDNYGLDHHGKLVYRNNAKNHFEYFQMVNKYNLLREDSITAACCLEYVELLDIESDKEEIIKLVGDAEKAAGDSLDVLQLCAIAYLKVGQVDKAGKIFRLLVNEDYNTVTNAQLLSTIYVDRYIRLKSDHARSDYLMLQSRVNPQYLFALPEGADAISYDQLQDRFVIAQRGILRTKYKLVFMEFIQKYEVLINRIIPLPESQVKINNDQTYAATSSAKEERVRKVQLVMRDRSKALVYKNDVNNISYSYEIIDILNQMFNAICILECVQDEHKQLELSDLVKEALHDNRLKIQDVEKRLSDFDAHHYEQIQEITLRKLAKKLFSAMAREIKDSVDSKVEMKDFAIAEFNLKKFCEHEGLTDPEVLYTCKDDVEIEDNSITFFTPDLLGEAAIIQSERIKMNKAMIDSIRKKMNTLVINNDVIEFYTPEDARMGRYFYNKSLQKFRGVRVKTLAVLDDRSKRDQDLLFTTEGIMPIIRGKAKNIVPYNEINWSIDGKKKALVMGFNYSNDHLNMDVLNELIGQLNMHASKVEKRSL